MVNEFHQVLIIRPNFTFDELASVMNRMGWQHDSLELETLSIIANEPEVACWSYAGQKPMVIYTFNPIVKMRVLDVASLPPALREALANQLPLLDNSAVERLFDSQDIRERLLGLWAAQETERLDLIEHARRMSDDPEPTLADQAREVCAKLERVEQARLEVMVQMKIMSEAAPALIRQLHDPAFVQTLKPTHEDLLSLFDEGLVNAAEQSIHQLYANSNLLVTLPQGAELKVVACPAGLLRWSNMLSDKFPGGYRDLAGWMTPNRIWMCWKVETAKTSMAYDGLVWIDDHWCWLPKIFRALVPYLFHGGAGSTRH